MDKLNNKVFPIISAVAEELDVKVYVIGGYVRDYFLNRDLTDIDIVVIGDGIELAEKLARKLKTKVTVYKTFGTAALKYNNCEIEIVGARKESYTPDSRKPTVVKGTLEDDQNRRDFTINAMAFSLNKANYGELLDPFNGTEELENKIIKTPLEPDTTFSDDPLRMMRAIRFATQLNFKIDPSTLLSIQRNANRLEIISMERITVEVQKIMNSQNPARGLSLLDHCGLLNYFLPELITLKGVERRGRHAHKDNFLHTIQVLENIAPYTQDDVWLRWAALLHDIAKTRTKRYHPTRGWTFHNHEVQGAKMVERIFRNLKLPLDERMRFVQKMVELHLRPIALVTVEVTDSAVRRLLFEAGDDVDKLMVLCEADITSGDSRKVQKYLNNFEIVRHKLVEIEQKDSLRNFQPPIDGSIIMETYDLKPSAVIGEIKNSIKDAIVDGDIPNDFSAAYSLMESLAQERGLVKKRAKCNNG